MKITKEQKKELKRVAEKYKLKLIILFGSFAIGKNRKDSDIDVGILPLSFLSSGQESAILKDLNGIFDEEVDLSILNRANQLLLYEIGKNSILLYGAKKEFFLFKLYSFHRYNDYLPFFKMEERLNKIMVKKYVR